MSDLVYFRAERTGDRREIDLIERKGAWYQGFKALAAVRAWRTVPEDLKTAVIIADVA